MIILNMHTVGRSFFQLSAAGRQASPRTTTSSGRCLGTSHSIEHISREVRVLQRGGAPSMHAPAAAALGAVLSTILAPPNDCRACPTFSALESM